MKDNVEQNNSGTTEHTASLVEKVVYGGVRVVGIAFEAVDLIEDTATKAKNMASQLRSKLPSDHRA